MVGEGLTELTPIPEPVDGVPAGRPRYRHELRHLAGDLCVGAFVSRLQFFFIPPLYTFTIAEPYELLALVIFLVVAVVSSALAGRVREQARIAANRMRAMRRLYEFTRRLSGLATLDGVAEGAASEIHASLGRPVVVLLAQDDDLALTRRLAARGCARCRRDDRGALGLQP